MKQIVRWKIGIVGALGDRFRALICPWCVPVPSFLSAGFAPCDPDQSVLQSWSGPEKLLALDELIDSCEPTQVKHMMQVIEPQFQRDFISLLPKEVGPYIYKRWYLPCRSLHHFCLSSDIASYLLRRHINHRKKLQSMVLINYVIQPMLQNTHK